MILMFIACSQIDRILSNGLSALGMCSNNFHIELYCESKVGSFYHSIFLNLARYVRRYLCNHESVKTHSALIVSIDVLANDFDNHRYRGQVNISPSSGNSPFIKQLLIVNME